MARIPVYRRASDLRPFFCFYGGKWRIARTYPPPEHDLIVEPFAGAAGYATRYADRRVLLVEKDPEIAALWAYLTRVSPEEVRRIPLLGHDQTVDDLRGAPPEAKSLVGFWLNKGSAAPRRRPSAWMRSSTRPKSYWSEEVRDRIASQLCAVRHWRVLHASYADAPDVEATWFVDPPYEGAGMHYRSGRPDYAKLADWVRSRRGLTVACENDGATWLPFQPHAVAQANPSKHGGKRSREVVYVQRTAPPAGGV